MRDEALFCLDFLNRFYPCPEIIGEEKRLKKTLEAIQEDHKFTQEKEIISSEEGEITQEAQIII
jgi:hypothetical protein